MSQANYKSTRLLVEAINNEIEDLRKTLMSVEPAAMPDRRGDVFAPTMTLRGLVDQLAEKADRVALADVRELAPVDYVAAMKPLVAEYHQLLAARDLLVPCLREDLGLNAVVLIMMDDTRSVVRAIHRPDRPEFELAVGAVVAAIEEGVKKAMEGEIVDLKAKLGVDPTVPEIEAEDDE
jgi:hypothetical protein